MFVYKYTCFFFNSLKCFSELSLSISLSQIRNIWNAGDFSENVVNHLKHPYIIGILVCTI